MTVIHRILCPVDFSEGAEAALSYAVFLAGQLGAKIHVLHVYQLPIYALPDGALMPGPDYAVRLQEDVAKGLDTLLARYPDVTIEKHVTEGIPHHCIVEQAKEVDAQLIVMGTHGRTGLEHFLVGSVAERVVRTSPVPVVTVPRKATAEARAKDA
jgi:nucleotide-binding universal stress UspA family protein